MIHVLGEGAPPTRAQVGGKALGLDGLIRAGERVPPGFCVTARAFRAYLEESGLAREAHRLLRAPVDPNASSRLSEIPHAAPLPAPLRAALADARPPPGARLAVRSSATDEDGMRSSFAGAHESFLDVAPDGLEGAIRACWASLWSERALLYRRQRGLGLDAEMAVVVQALVPAVASAVAFGRHPVTGCRDKLVISCCAGLGEAMISDGGDALTFTIARGSWEILELDGDDEADDLPIADAAVVELAVAVDSLEARFAIALDVEAAHDGASWWLVQARPISA